jgi:predicted RNase H-like HicB family nuclease
LVLFTKPLSEYKIFQPAEATESRRPGMMYHFKIHEERDGFWAECAELPGCRTQAETGDELAAACEESLNLYLEEPQDSKVVFPLPDEVLDARSIIPGNRG